MEGKEQTVQEVIKKFIPCEVCGNKDITKFRLRGVRENGIEVQSVRCDECKETYPLIKE